MGAWRRVVKPRVGAFHFFAGVTALPALGYNAALDSSMTGAVLSMVHAPEELFAFLGQHLDLPRSLFDEDAFHQREAADVARYLLHASLDSADSGRFRAALERFRKRLRAVTGNPYLRPA
jgi:hypothetical protein